MKFYLDEDLSPAIAEQLALAARESRCLVTKNVSDFTALAHNAVQQETPHAGIVLCPASVPGDDIGTILTRLRQVVERFPEGLGPYDAIYL